MPRIVTTLEFHQKPKDHLWDMMRRVYEQLAVVINGQIDIASVLNQVAFTGIADPRCNVNVHAAFVGVTTPGVANTNFTVTHNLGYVPRAYIPIVKGASVDIYDGSPLTITTTTITLRATVINVNVILMIF